MLPWQLELQKLVWEQQHTQSVNTTSYNHKPLSTHTRTMAACPKTYFIINFKQLILCSTDHGSAQPISIICIWG